MTLSWNLPVYNILQDTEITAAVKARLQDTDSTYDNIFEFRYHAIQPNDCPCVNIIIPSRTYEMDPGRGAYKTTRKVVLVLIASGLDSNADASKEAKVRLDDLEDFVFRALLFRHDKLGLPGLMAFRLSESTLEPDDKTDKVFLKRYITFECVTADRFPAKVP